MELPDSIHTLEVRETIFIPERESAIPPDEPDEICTIVRPDGLWLSLTDVVAHHRNQQRHEKADVLERILNETLGGAVNG